MTWDDDAYGDPLGRPPRAASARQILLRVAAYTGVVVGVVGLIFGAIYAVTAVGVAVKPGGFAPVSAHGERAPLPPVSSSLGDDEEAVTDAPSEATAGNPTEVTGSEVAPMTEPDAPNITVDANVEDSWVARISQATGIPARALSAYALAHVSIAQADPDCGLDWATIAAIGDIESGHGSHGGSVLRADGLVSPEILGPRLDGTRFAAIRDTDGGVFDGDTEWDRAVGPMQFIPSTWERWGIDANGDGIANPHQIDDAAHATALYLCNAGPMTSAEGWRAAVYSYNHDNDYVDKVARIANEYAASVIG